MNKVDNLITQFRGKTFSSNKDAETWLKGKICSLLREQEKQTSLRTKEWMEEMFDGILKERDDTQYAKGIIKGKKLAKEPHLTEDEWCCACEADVAVFNSLLKEQREEMIEKIEGMKRTLNNAPLSPDSIPSDLIDLKLSGYNQALKDITNLLKE